MTAAAEVYVANFGKVITLFVVDGVSFYVLLIADCSNRQTGSSPTYTVHI